MTVRRTESEYAAMQADFEAGNWEAVGPPEPGPGSQVQLKNGRPAGRKKAGGNTPSMSVRLPADLRTRLEERATVESVKPAEVIRRALAAYLDDPLPH